MNSPYQVLKVWSIINYILPKNNWLKIMRSVSQGFFSNLDIKFKFIKATIMFNE